MPKPVKKITIADRLRVSDVDSACTFVELTFHKGRIENRIRFGQPTAEEIVDRHRRIMTFAAGSILCFVRWAANDHGTIISRADILRAVRKDEPYQTLPFVRPGGDILLRADGWPKVECVLQAIDAIEAADIDPADVAPDYWRHVHNRLSVKETPRAYTYTRHQAWLKRREIGA